MSVRELDDRFEPPSLNGDIWFPYYLPHWSSWAESAATYRISSEGFPADAIEGDPPRTPEMRVCRISGRPLDVGS